MKQIYIILIIIILLAVLGAGGYLVKKFYLGEFCGRSSYGHCNTNDDCLERGCSGQVCMSKSDEPMGTTCEWRNCYKNELYGMQCRCVKNRCQWATFRFLE
ncbi:MAG: eight-cysteine-cluster domain-containing protein [bacterium]